MPIHLIRHGHAGHRKGWHGPDVERPLSSRGQREAEGLAGELGGARIDVLWSSPFLRCRQTLAPLSAALGLDVIDQEALAEGAEGAPALDALLGVAASGHVVAASTHGDVVSAIVRAAAARGAQLTGPSSLAKGARYVIEVVDGPMSTITHVAAPQV